MVRRVGERAEREQRAAVGPLPHPVLDRPPAIHKHNTQPGVSVHTQAYGAHARVRLASTRTAHHTHSTPTACQL